MKKFKGMTLTRKILSVASVYFLAFTISGCAITVPGTDTTRPDIRLEISGPGIGRQVMTNPPRDNWTSPDGTQLFNILPNIEYSFLLTVSDQGGAARAHIRMPENFSVTELTPASAREEVVGLTRSITLLGSRMDPRAGLIISGKFRTPTIGRQLAFTLSTEADDFGGLSGRTNQRFMNVQLSLVIGE